MIPLVADNLNQIRAICQQLGVARLELFGSASRGDFNPETSDIDFIVEFIDYGPGISDRFFGLIDALEDLFGRKVDVSSARTLKNPYMIAAIEEGRTTLYDAGHRSAAA